MTAVKLGFTSSSAYHGATNGPWGVFEHREHLGAIAGTDSNVLCAT
ncbi:hypothetical protein ACFW95_39220 [Streptomyces sp. NPDC059474]